jgi:hypothetical protein
MHAQAHTSFATTTFAEAVMKPLWTQTLAWLVAVVAAVLLAFASPAGLGVLFEADASHGAGTPR